MMKKIALLFLVLMVILTGVGCESVGGYEYDYQSAYERLNEKTASLDHRLEALEVTGSEEIEDSEKGICVCMGDGVTSLFDPPYDYPSVIAEQTGLDVINGAFGSCRMSAHEEGYVNYDAFSMYRLADAIATGDWSLQDQYIESITTDYRNSEVHLAALKSLDWNEVDILTIAYGTSDIHSGIAIESENPTDTKTVAGALRYSIEKIQTAYPHIKIVILTPIYRVWIEEGLDSDDRTVNGYRFIDYVDKMISVAEEYKLPCLDLYRTSGFNRLTYGYYYIDNNGQCPNVKGQIVLGKKIAAALDGLY